MSDTTTNGNDKVKFKFSGGKVTWITYKGPDQGIADVIIDGVDKGTVDLYSASVQYQVPQVYSGLGSGTHVIYVKVTGTKNANASDSNVVLDAFKVGATTTEDTSVKVKYNNWKGKSNASASGGTYRQAGSHNATVFLTFAGTSIDWITAKGPKYGKADVFIDNVPQGGHIDLYAPTQQWQVAISFGPLAGGSHLIEVRPTHTKNSASSGRGVVIDAFRGPIIVARLADLARDPSLAAEPASSEVFGTIKAVNARNGTLTITPNNGGAAIRLKVNADDAEIELNDDEAALFDLKAGMVVDVEYDTASKSVRTIDADDLSAPDASRNTDSASFNIENARGLDLLSWLSSLLFGN